MMESAKSPRPTDEGRSQPGQTGGPELSLRSPAPLTEVDITEEALVEAARALETEAWATIYERHHRQVYAYAYHRIGDREAAEDLASEVFVRALAGIRSYRYRGRPLLAWLYRIAHNLTSDHLRTRARYPIHSTQTDEGLAELHQDLEVVPARQDLQQALRSLSRDQQQVIILRFMQGFSSDEVGAILGKRAEAVRALQFRAMAALRRRLSADRGPSGGKRQA